MYQALLIGLEARLQHMMREQEAVWVEKLGEEKTLYNVQPRQPPPLPDVSLDGELCNKERAALLARPHVRCEREQKAASPPPSKLGEGVAQVL